MQRLGGLRDITHAAAGIEGRVLNELGPSSGAGAVLPPHSCRCRAHIPPCVYQPSASVHRLLPFRRCPTTSATTCCTWRTRQVRNNGVKAAVQLFCHQLAPPVLMARNAVWRELCSATHTAALLTRPALTLEARPEIHTPLSCRLQHLAPHQDQRVAAAQPPASREPPGHG